MSHYLSDADVVGSTPTWTMFFVLLLMWAPYVNTIFAGAHKRNKFNEDAPIRFGHSLRFISPCVDHIQRCIFT